MLGVQVAAKNATAYTADLAAATTMLQSEYKDLVDGVVVGTDHEEASALTPQAMSISC